MEIKKKKNRQEFILLQVLFDLYIKKTMKELRIEIQKGDKI